MSGQEWPLIQAVDPSSSEVFRIQADSSLHAWNGEHWTPKRRLTFKGIVISDLKGVEKLNPVLWSNPMRFIGHGTQQVYLLEDSVFSRLDSTLERGHNFNSIQWQSGDTLFSLGGSGFGLTHALFSYFDINSGNWEELPTNEGPERIETGFHHFSVDRKKLFITLVAEEANELDPTVWELNIQQRKWSSLGRVNDETRKLLISGKVLNLPIGIAVSGSTKQLVDLSDNRVDRIDAAVCDLQFRTNNAFENGVGTLVSWDYVEDAFIPNPNSSQKSISLKYTYQSIFNARRKVGAAYTTGWAWWVYLAILGGTGALVWLLRKLLRKLKEPFEKGQTVAAEERFFQSLNPGEIKLLRALLGAEMRGEGLLSGPITEIMGWKEKSWDNQRKWRNNLIKDLNKRGEEHLNIEELIVSNKNPRDKRERVYRLDPNGFRLLRDSLHF